MSLTPWQSKVVTLDEAFRRLAPGQRIVTAMAAAEPTAFYAALDERLTGLRELTIFGANPSRDFPCFRRLQDLARQDVRFMVMFLTGAVNHYGCGGPIHYIPQHLSQWARHILDAGQVDVFWGSCTPPDARGFVSLGPSNCYESEILRQACTVVLEINPRLPFTHGATQVHIDRVDAFVEGAHPLPTLSRVAYDAVDEAIAALVAAEIEDGATLQLGIGGIPNALGQALKGKRDLGIHTEMINDVMMHLAMAGVITGRRKTLWPDKIVGAFAYGSPELYAFLDGNPLVELHPASIVNDPYRIGRNHRMVSVNSAVEVDVTGQVCSESVGHRELSGVGGAAETHIGAQRSEGGKGIIALRATTRDGQSKIVTTLKPGAKVSISRNDVDTVVTEHGVARLKGRSVAERVHALVAIAAPDARAGLLEEARAAGYVC